MIYLCYINLYMSNVVYLLGAGASYYSMPLSIGNKITHITTLDDIESGKVVINEGDYSFSEDLMRVAGKIESLYNIGSLAHHQHESAEDVKKITRLMFEFSAESGKFKSIDTYARYIWITNPDKFDLLKESLFAYFWFKQHLLNFRPDYRVADFLVTIVNKDKKIPESINILSWNYDTQLESEFYRLFPESKGFQSHYSSTRISDINSYIIHLNGMGITKKESNKYHYCNFKELDSFLSKYCHHDLESDILFSWERETDDPDYIHSKNIMSNSNVLVIIGYSFPFFNKEVDNQLISWFKTPALKNKKIYLQDKIDLTDKLKARFNLNCPIEYIGDTSSYYVPVELS